MAARKIAQKQKIAKNKKRKYPKKRRSRLSKLQDQILDILAVSADLLGTAGHLAIYKNRYPQIYGTLGATTTTEREEINVVIRDLIAGGLIKEDPGQGLLLTPLGRSLKKSLHRGRSRAWDGNWRVVFFDIPEKKRILRDELRAELRALGFGSWQKSVWVIPFAIEEELQGYLLKNNISDQVQVVVGRRVGGGSDRDFAAQVWPLARLNKEYAELVSNWEAELGSERSEAERLARARDFHSRFVNILRNDPQLPPELLPPDWQGFAAQKAFAQVTSLLALSTQPTRRPTRHGKSEKS